ncbi:GAF domain-containing protein [Leptolyngbya sp. FACHB-261]|nr:GAF domain-containing protein [Leptolyngbya sp. FACHB-261]
MTRVAEAAVNQIWQQDKDRASNRLLQGIVQATHQLLNGEGSTIAVQQILETLGQATESDSAYFFTVRSQSEPGEPALIPQFVWQRQHTIQSNKFNQIQTELDNQFWVLSRSSLGDSYDQLLTGNCVVGEIDELPESAQRQFVLNEITSILLIPVFVEERFWGCLGFGSGLARRWFESEIEVLKTVATNLGKTTAYRQTEQALRQSGAQLQCIAANVPGVIYQVLRRSDGLRSVLFVSSGCRQLLELEPETLQADFTQIVNLIHPGDREAYEQAVNLSAQSLEPLNWEGRLKTPSGRLKWVQFASRPERQTNGNILWNGLLLDITKRKQAEEELRQSQSQNRALLDAIPDLMFRIRRDGTYIDFRAASENEFAVPSDLMLNRSVYDVLPLAVAEQRMQAIEQALQTKRLQTFEYQLLKQGNLRDYEARIVAHGEDEALAIMRDITERKQADTQLRTAVERDRLLAEMALRIRQSLDLDQILQTTVAEVRQFLQADRVFICRIDADLQGEVVVESVGSEWLPVLGAQALRLKELNTTFKQGCIQSIDDVTQVTVSPIRAQYFARYQVKASVGVSIILDDQLYGMLVAHQCSQTRHWQPFEIDLLEQLATQVAIAMQQANLFQQVQTLNTNLERQVEERTAQLQQKMQELQELNRLKDVFLHAVSHDLRTPVMGSLMVLRSLLNKPGDSVSIPRSVLERMIQGSDCQLNLINSLLETHSGQGQGAAASTEPLQLWALVQETLDEARPLLLKNQVTSINRIDLHLPPVKADPNRLRQVFENLIINAIKHNPPGLELTLAATVEGSMVRCTIHDNGVGMTEAECKDLFELYIRDSNRRRSTGLGLGLYLCRQIITAHGGQIGVTSAPQSGTTFWLTLPLAAFSNSEIPICVDC